MKKNLINSLALMLVCMACHQGAEKKQETYVPVNDKVKLASFPYAAPKPVNGTLYGIVELGGSSFNSFIIEKDDADRWKMIKSNYGESKVVENENENEAIKTGLKEYVDEMIKRGVSKDLIYFIQSSTASKNKKVQELNPILEELGYNVVGVNVDKEAAYAFYATMPKEFQDEAFVLDIGSGNTKISWLEEDSVMTKDAPGSKYYQYELSDSAVYSAVYELVASIPAQKRKKCFLIGGAPYKLALESNEFAEQYTVINAPGEYTTDDAKILCGLNIYKAAFDASPESEGFIFDWYSNFTIGYLLQEF
ncbi:MAG: hypothetical protein ACI9A7_000793 [Cyclobacteriaceae bacterium]|jgi:hypothetical protein